MGQCGQDRGRAVCSVRMRALTRSRKAAANGWFAGGEQATASALRGMRSQDVRERQGRVSREMGGCRPGPAKDEDDENDEAEKDGQADAGEIPEKCDLRDPNGCEDEQQADTKENRR